MKPAYFPVLILFRMFCSLKREMVSLDFVRKFLKKPVAMGIMKRKKIKKYLQFMQMKLSGLNLEDIWERRRRFSERKGLWT